MKLSVLNPGGHDPEQHFADAAGGLDDVLHPPVNYHGFAACTRGGFFRKMAALPADAPAVLVLIRRDLKAVRQAVADVRQAGKTVAIAWKEAGAMQVAAQLEGAARVRLFQEICALAQGAIAATPELVTLFRGAGMRHVEFIPTPYPIEDARWDFSALASERRGIFLGTREFDTPSRQHLAALLALKPLAETTGQPVTVFNVDGRRGRRTLAELGFGEGLLNVIENRLPYPRYLRVVARHQIVFQLDASAVPGQVAGDALLCRVPCVGGNGTTERLVFPALCGHGRTTEELLSLARGLLEKRASAEASVGEAVALAGQRLGFNPVAAQLEAFFARLRD